MTRDGSKNASCASAKAIPCLRWFSASLRGSHSKLGFMRGIITYVWLNGHTKIWLCTGSQRRRRSGCKGDSRPLWVIRDRQLCGKQNLRYHVCVDKENDAVNLAIGRHFRKHLDRGGRHESEGCGYWSGTYRHQVDADGARNAGVRSLPPHGRCLPASGEHAAVD